MKLCVAFFPMFKISFPLSQSTRCVYKTKLQVSIFKHSYYFQLTSDGHCNSLSLCTDALWSWMQSFNYCEPQVFLRGIKAWLKKRLMSLSGYNFHRCLCKPANNEYKLLSVYSVPSNFLVSEHTCKAIDMLPFYHQKVYTLGTNT